MNKRIAIIVAGGSGTRFGGPVPKQFLPLAGKPVLMHTIGQFARAGQVSIVLVLPQSQIDHWHDLCRQYHFTTPHTVVAGGDSRFMSVKHALTSLTIGPGDLVAVHDGVRPLVSPQLINAAYDAARRTGSAVPATAVTDSVRQLGGDGGASVALDRSTLRAVQTPQTFDGLALLRAYDVPFSPVFTDDASVLEHAGGTITLIPGETTNIKITHRLDLMIAEELLAHEPHD